MEETTSAAWKTSRLILRQRDWSHGIKQDIEAFLFNSQIVSLSFENTEGGINR